MKLLHGTGDRQNLESSCGRVKIRRLWGPAIVNGISIGYTTGDGSPHCLSNRYTGWIYELTINGKHAGDFRTQSEAVAAAKKLC